MIASLNNRKKISKTNGQRGFTLVDILVGLAIASVLMVAMVSLFTSMGRSYTTQNVAADVQQIARAGVDLMVRQIRMAAFDPAGTAAAAIVADFDSDRGFHEDHNELIAPTDANNIAFTVDADMDGRIDHCVDLPDDNCTAEDDNVENEMFAYRINNGALERYRAGNAQWEDLTQDNVSALQFTYFDATGAETTAVDAIRAVEISMTVQLPAGRGGAVSRTYSTRVRCRNIGL